MKSVLGVKTCTFLKNTKNYKPFSKYLEVI